MSTETIVIIVVLIVLFGGGAVTGFQDGGKPLAKAEKMRSKSALQSFAVLGISGAFGLSGESRL